MDLLRIDLEEKESKYQSLADDLVTFGGRGLIAHILNEEVPPKCYPLGEKNKLIICTGPLAGANISSAGRLSIGGKSPLTGGIKESNTGGICSNALARLGLRGIVLDKKIKEDKWYLLKIEEDGVEFIPATKYLGMGNYQLSEELFNEYGKNYSIISIGPTGENHYLNSGLAATDLDYRQSRMAARGGLGALMGSKNIKAVMINKEGTYSYDNIETEAFKKARKNYHKVVTESDRVEVLREYGTASTVMEVQRLGALPVNNFSQGKCEEAENLSGEKIHEIIEERGGEGRNSEPCMSGCIIQCSNAYPDEKGKEIVSPLEYETLGLIGFNLGITDPDKVAEINYLCNDYGLDTIETGGVLGVMAEAGMFDFGDAEAMISAIKEVPEDSWKGRLIGMGTGITAKFLNVRRAPVVKNQCMSAYDPRGVKGTGVTYATSPMGADHTAGLTVFMPMDHHDKEGQIETSLNMQITRAAYDTLGLCVFLLAATATEGDKVVEMLNSLYDLNHDSSYIDFLGKKTIEIERKFNKRAGFTDEDDTIPEYFKEEELPPYNLTWDIEKEELCKIFKDFE